MYSQPFVPSQVYAPTNMMYAAPMPQQVAAAPTNVPAGTVVPAYPQYRPGFNPMINSAVPWQQSMPPASGPGVPAPRGPHQHAVGASYQPHAQNQQPRQRNNEIGDVSCVVHLRNVTPEVTQLSIQNLAQNFGNVNHIVMLRQMNQALIEMESEKCAQDFVNCFRETGFAEIDGRRVYVRYSNHRSLTAPQHVSRTLLASMFNTQYDVSVAAQITPEIVHKIFYSYGKVQKIVLLPKNESSQWNHNRVQALVQFDTPSTAEYVKSILQGQPVTLGESVMFTLDIQFSRMDEIKTSNPYTSLVVDEDGNAHRPEPPAPGEEGHEEMIAHEKAAAAAAEAEGTGKDATQEEAKPAAAEDAVPVQDQSNWS